MTVEADSAKSKVLLITSDVDSYTNLRTYLGDDWYLQKLDDADSPEEIGIESTRSDIVIILRPDLPLHYLEGLRNLVALMPVPIILFVGDDPYNLAPIAIRYGITSVIVDGFEPKRIPKLIEVSRERFQLHRSLQSEVARSQEELAARKVIERAKGLLMDKRQMSEQEAYGRLRALAMQQSKTMKEVAETLILYSDILP